MPNTFKTLSVILILSFIGVNGFSQNNLSVRWFEQIRSETQLSYSFFTGPDAGDFQTSVKGFGSGILDIFSTRSSADLVQFGSKRLFISFGTGFSVQKYRLARNLVFEKPEEGPFTWAIDPDTTHEYGNTFFSYGKTKIVTTSIYFPLDLNIAMGKNIMASVGGYLDLNLTARYKAKYQVDDVKVKDIIRSAEFRKLGPSPAKLGVSASLYFRKPGYGVSASYCLTPFFKPGSGPVIREARVSASYSIRNIKNITKD